MPRTDISPLAYCLVDGTAIFLDIPGNRYFRLSPSCNADFVAMVAGEPVSVQAMSGLARAGIACDGGACPVRAGMGGVDARRQAAAVTSGPFRFDDVARVLWFQRRIEKRLARRGLAAMLDEIVCRRDGNDRCLEDANDCSARMLRAFEYSRLLRSSAGRCLPRSVSVVLALARCGVHADLVIGVKLGPFAAHCWAQIGKAVVSDTVEEVACFTPILVV